MSNDTLPPAGGQAPPAGNTPPGQAPTQTLPQAGDDQQQQQDDLQKVISDLRKENAAHRRKAKEQEEAAQAAEAESLKKRGEYQVLAEKHEARVHELEPIATRYTALAEQVSAQIEDEVKNWPAEVKTFDPGRDAPVESRLEWRNKSRPLIDKLQGQARGNLPGNRPNPTPQGQHSREEMITANRKELQKSRTYGI